ncbi:hypothetical protein KR084_012820, partial [Drosophila pseudotakahashii]
AANKLAARLEEACDQSMDQRRTFRKDHSPVHWWTEEIASLRRTCHRARRLVQRARGTPNLETLNKTYKAAKKALKLSIRDSKRECYWKLCDELENDPWGRAYKMVVKRMSAGNRSPSDPSALEAIVQALFPAGRRHSIPRCTSGISDSICPVTEAELLATARVLPNKKAPGPDSVPNGAVKALLSLQTKAVADLFNKCLVEGTFPDRWKRQKLLL